MLPDDDTVRRLGDHLAVLYGRDTGTAVLSELREVTTAALARPSARWDPGHRPGPVDKRGPFSETDVFVIAYGDHVTSPGTAPLQTLGRFLARVAPEITGLHLLPHYPATSDGGFAVADHDAVDPELGSWADVHELASRYRLMLDSVLNHTSRSSSPPIPRPTRPR